MRRWVMAGLVLGLAGLCLAGCGLEGGKGPAAGYVQGEGVVTYSYVPNRYWKVEEGVGVLPYLCEYELMAWDSDRPLEAFHAENVRRIDLASQWSTCIMFYARELHFRDEIIRLMIRAYRHRQLFVVRDYWQPGDERKPFEKIIDLLEALWAKRDEALVNPEGDRATGRQLINNVLMVKMGDENFCGLRTAGLGTMYRVFREQVQERELGGERPFGHIKAWYNMVAWGAWNFGSCWASGPADEGKAKRARLPGNTEFIGVDTYDYWWLGIPYDPGEAANRAKVRGRVEEWHRIRTRYYPEGVETRVCENANDPATWTAACWSDTHGLLNAIRYAQAEKAMMIYIGLSSSLPGKTYITPVETMDAYYDNLKAGPWVGLVWWTSVGQLHPEAFAAGTLGYVDETLMHYTPERPEGVAFTAEESRRLRESFLASRRRMFEDVVYGQFGHLNGRKR